MYSLLHSRCGEPFFNLALPFWLEFWPSAYVSCYRSLLSSSMAGLTALALCLVSFLALVSSETPFVQDVAFRSFFADQAESQVSAAWEELPFSLKATGLNEDCDFARKGKMVSTAKAFYVVDGGNLYCSSLKQPVPEISSLESPYNAWTVVGDTGVAGANIMVEAHGLFTNSTSTKNKVGLYAATDRNVALIILEGEGCGAISSVDMLIDEEATYKWGTVNALEIAESTNSLYLATTGEGALSFSLEQGSSKKATRILGDRITGTAYTLKWVEEWQTLYISTHVALFTLRYEGGALAEDDHEWIGGVLGTVVVDLEFDHANQFLWLVESESLHKLNKAGIYFRYGWQQGAPMYNISTVAIVQGGQVYAGSDAGLGMSRVSATASPAQVDAVAPSIDGVAADAVSTTSDPWAWAYYYGPRYLPSNTIHSIIRDNREGAGDSILIATDVGLTYLRAEQMTLEQKAAALQKNQIPRHDRHGLISPVNLNEFGVLSSYHKSTNDNDGLWTGMSVMGLAYRYAESLKNGGKGDDEARVLAWNGFEALEHLSTITGAYPSFVARSLCKVSDDDLGCPTPDPDCVDDCWYHAPDREGWYYKGDTSSDELCGHFAAYALVHDHVAETAEQKARVLKLMEGLLMGIVDNDLYLIQPATGKRTLWGFWNPQELNYEPQHYSERGTNSLEILAWLTQAYSITGNNKYKEQFYDLVKNHKYVQNTYNVKIDSAIDENHSDTELIMLAYHSLFYADQRLEAGHPRKQEVQAMIEPLVVSLKKSFMLMKGELSPLWLGIYAGTAAQTDMIQDKDLSDATWTLRRWAMDFIQWEVMGSQRIDLDFTDHYHVRYSGKDRPVMRHIRPPTERRSGEWNSDPFDVNPGGDGMGEYEPGTWLLPYFLMQFNGLIR